MKWTIRYAALLAALVLSLGMVSIMRPGVAAADSDEVMIRAPGDRGDPDTGGGNYFTTFRWRLVMSAARGPFACHTVSRVRFSVPSRQQLSICSRQGRAARR